MTPYFKKSLITLHQKREDKNLILIKKIVENGWDNNIV